jgi:hypothetical protein
VTRSSALLVLGAFLLVGLSASEAMAPDAWAEAAAYYQQYGASRKPEERAGAASRLVAGMDGKHDKLAANLLLGLLTSELGRDDSGRKEDQVYGDVLRNCEDSLRRTSTPDAVDILVREAKKSRSLRVRFHLARALGGVKGDVAARTLGELIDDKEVLLTVGVAGGLRERPDDSGVELAFKVLKRKDCPWEAAIGALAALEKMKKPEKTMGGLIELLDSMKADTGRTKARLLEALGRISAIPEPRSDDAAWWKEAWASKAAGTDISKPDAMPASEGAEFYGIKSRSTRIVFLIDTCGGMETAFFRAGALAAKAPDPKKPDDPKKTTGKKGADLQEEAAKAKAEEMRKRADGRVGRKKFEDVKRELIDTVVSLDPHVLFSIIWFDNEPRAWKEELVPATWLNKLACIQDIEKTSVNGGSGSNFWNALEMAFRFAANAQKPDSIQIDKKADYATLLKGPDTFYLISGARPTNGKFVTSGASVEVDVTAFMAEFEKVLAVRPVALNTIALGDPEADGDWMTANSLRFIRKLAETSGGEFVHLAPGK